MNFETSLSWVQEVPNGNPHAARSAVVAGIKPRRTHTKSRKGCNACKRRRKKCDEITPICGQCRHLRTRCDYTYSNDHTYGMTMAHGRSQYSMSRRTARNDVLEVLEDSTVRKRALGKLQFECIDVLQLLDHFLTEKTAWIGSPGCQKVVQRHGFELGLEAPHLLHAILAFAAAHIDYLHPDPKSRSTAIYHYDRLVALYAEQVANLGTGNVTQLYGTCTLLSMLSYLTQSYDNVDPNLLEHPEDHECDWNAFRTLQSGRILQDIPSLRAHLQTSVWLPALMEAGPWEEDECAIDTSDHGRLTWYTHEMEQLGVLCGVSSETYDRNNIYLSALTCLDRIMSRGDVGVDSIGELMKFVNKLSAGFVNALEQLDPRACLVIAYWHALLLRTKQWWILGTGIGGCRRSIAYLRDVGGDDMRSLLRFPAEQCGYDPDSLSMIR